MAFWVLLYLTWDVITRKYHNLSNFHHLVQWQSEQFQRASGKFRKILNPYTASYAVLLDPIFACDLRYLWIVTPFALVRRPPGHACMLWRSGSPCAHGLHVSPVRATIYNTVLTLITVWTSNYIHYKIWDEITDPFLNFNGATVKILERISNSFSNFTGQVITYPIMGLKLNHISKRVSGIEMKAYTL